MSRRPTRASPRWQRPLLPGELREAQADAALGARLGRRRARCCVVALGLGALRARRHVGRPQRRSAGRSTSCSGRRAAPRCGGAARTRVAVARGDRCSPAIVSAAAGGAGAIALFNAAIRARAAGARRWLVGARAGRRRRVPALLPGRRQLRARADLRPADHRSSSSAGGCSSARSASWCSRCASAPSGSRPSSGCASSRRARPSGAGSRARCTTCSPTACRCCRLHAGALEFRPDAPPEEIAEAAGGDPRVRARGAAGAARGDRRAARRRGRRARAAAADARRHPRRWSRSRARRGDARALPDRHRRGRRRRPTRSAGPPTGSSRRG